MNPKNSFRRLIVLGCILSTSPFLETALAQTPGAPAKYPDYPSETPTKLVPMTSRFDSEKREVMIPMRDGIKLHTVIVVPKGAKDTGILLTRTPYHASSFFGHIPSSHFGPSLENGDSPIDVVAEERYIRVFQDLRGKYDSEGDYVMTRPLHGPLNPTPVDH
jgi:predicted acyl esterase